MSTFELALHGVARRKLEEASRVLFGLGALGLQEDWLPGEAPEPLQPWDTGPPPPLPERVLLRAWFEHPDQAAITVKVRRFAVTHTWQATAEIDWEAAFRASFPPVAIAEDLVIATPWDAPPGALLIEPGTGFGTGHHPSTQQALALMHALLKSTDGHATALDVGCGSGVLALVAARHGLSAVGIDVEDAAIRDAAANAALNGLAITVSTTPVAAVPGTFDLVLANLHAELVQRLGDDLVRLCARTLIVAGILADREALVHAALCPPLHLAERIVTDEWVALRFVRT